MQKGSDHLQRKDQGPSLLEKQEECNQCDNNSSYFSIVRKQVNTRLKNCKNIAPKLKGAKYFSKIDLYRAYYLIPLSLSAQAKSCVLTPFGAYNYTRLPMGMKNSAQAFQRLVDSVLSGLDNTFCYLDDILIYNDNEEDHLKTLQELFTRLQG